MKTLTKIKIAGKTYKISRTKKMASDLFGGVTHEDSLIKLSTDLGKEMESETLLHEVVHCISYNNDLKLDEKQVTSLSSNLFQVLKDNGWWG